MLVSLTLRSRCQVLEVYKASIQAKHFLLFGPSVLDWYIKPPLLDPYCVFEHTTLSPETKVYDACWGCLREIAIRLAI